MVRYGTQRQISRFRWRRGVVGNEVSINAVTSCFNRGVISAICISEHIARPLRFPRRYSRANIYKIMVGAHPMKTMHRGTQFNVSLTDSFTIHAFNHSHSDSLDSCTCCAVGPCMLLRSITLLGIPLRYQHYTRLTSELTPRPSHIYSINRTLSSRKYLYLIYQDVILQPPRQQTIQLPSD